MIKWKDYRNAKLQDPEIKKAYDELEAEYSIMRAMLNLRKELGLSQVQLSSITGVAQSDIDSLETGKANPPISTLKKIADACGKKLVVQFV